MNSNFCGKCGTKLDKKTGLCPNCDAKQLKRTKKGSVSLGRRILHFLIRALLILLLLIILGLSAILILAHFNVIHLPTIESIVRDIGAKKTTPDSNHNDMEPINLDDYKIEAPNPNDIFNDHFEIVEVTDIADSNNSLTEEELIIILNERGFTEYPITTNYDMEGHYSDSKEVAPSTEKHPIYETSYISSNNEYWIISVVDGDIMATPVNFNIESNSNTSVLISESNYVTSYVSSTNQFYRTIPDESVLDVIVVDKINTDALDRLTLEELP